MNKFGLLIAGLALSAQPLFAEGVIAPQGEIMDALQLEEIGNTAQPERWQRYYTCYAENRRGQVFRAEGRRPRPTQQRAMNRCFQYSRQCRAMGCETTYVWEF